MLRISSQFLNFVVFSNELGEDDLLSKYFESGVDLHYAIVSSGDFVNMKPPLVVSMENPNQTWRIDVKIMSAVRYLDYEDALNSNLKLVLPWEYDVANALSRYKNVVGDKVNHPCVLIGFEVVNRCKKYVLDYYPINETPL